ncbi:MAG: hypothetical protein OEM59_19510, partial [Rhodospirillales bacterium]|nr:hypothetical protein [Rhodospirillales bacterium]
PGHHQIALSITLSSQRHRKALRLRPDSTYSESECGDFFNGLLRPVDIQAAGMAGAISRQG